MTFEGPDFHSCTPGDSLRLLDAYDVPLVAKHAVAVGRSPIPGKPVGMVLLPRNGSILAPWSWTPDTTPAMSAMSSTPRRLSGPALSPQSQGRVGPMTIAVLLAQTIAAAQTHSAVDV